MVPFFIDPDDNVLRKKSVGPADKAGKDTSDSKGRDTSVPLPKKPVNPQPASTKDSSELSLISTGICAYIPDEINDIYIKSTSEYPHGLQLTTSLFQLANSSENSLALQFITLNADSFPFAFKIVSTSPATSLTSETVTSSDFPITFIYKRLQIQIPYRVFKRLWVDTTENADSYISLGTFVGIIFNMYVAFICSYTTMAIQLKSIEFN